MASDIKTFYSLSVCLYSTLLPQAGRQLELRWRASRESHPSEELSEPQYGSIIMG